MKTAIKKTTLLFLLLLLVITLSVTGQEAQPEKRLALIGFDNMDENDEHDYLTALITAVIREDISGTEGIILLERSLMNKVLDEQKMQISGLFDDQNAVEAGKLLGSDYLAGGGYIVMDTEVLVDITLIDVETGAVVSFSSRGNSEDIIHLVAEKIVRELTGKRHIFRTAESDRPIIKETLMPPGTLKFFSPMIRARIYIDGEFYGYTTGNATIPVEVELQPGLHTIKTDVGHDFGIVKEPEILFKKWETEFEIKSGKSVVLEDPSRHFNDRLYDLQKIIRDDKTFYLPDSKPFNSEYDFSFTDRKGNPVTGSLTVLLTPTEVGGVTAQAMLIYNTERHVFDLQCRPGEAVELERDIGLIRLGIELSCRYRNRIEADWDLWRNDVYQGLHREEGLTE